MLTLQHSHLIELLCWSPDPVTVRATDSELAHAGHALMISLSGLLKQIAVKHNIAVLVRPHLLSSESPAFPGSFILEVWRFASRSQLASRYKGKIY
jgi:hypothetical protein